MISVIIPVQNGASTIERCIRSILNQDVDYEIIIADGRSTDKTISIIEGIDCPKIKIVSRSDNGIYDGINRGITRASGDVISILNSDDWYVPNILKRILSYMNDYDVYTGCVGLIDGINVHTLNPKQNRFTGCSQLMPLPHIGLFLKRSIIEKLGKYDTSYKIAGDLDYINRLIRIIPRNRIVLDGCIVAFADNGGISSKNTNIHEAKEIAINAGYNKYASYLLYNILKIRGILKKY